MNVGFLVGFNYHTTLIGLLAGLALVILFSYALSWMSALIGLLVPNAETAQAEPGAVGAMGRNQNPFARKHVQPTMRILIQVESHWGS